MPDTDSTFKYQVFCYEQSLSLYKKLKITHEIPGVLKLLAGVHLMHNRYDLAEQYLLEGIRIKKSLGIKKIHHTTLNLSHAYLNLGRHDEALRYALLAIHNADSLGEQICAGLLATTGQRLRAIE